MAKEATINDTGGNKPAEGGSSSTPQAGQTQDLKETIIAHPIEPAPAEADKTGEKGKEAKEKEAQAEAEKAVEAQKLADDEKKATEAKAAQEAQEQEEETKRQKDFDGRLDKHPRFKEVITERNDLRKTNQRLTDSVSRLEAKIETLEKVRGADDKGRKRDYVDVSALSDDEIKEKFEDDAKGFMANLTRQIRAEVVEEVEGKVQGLIGTSLKGMTEEDKNRAMGEFYDDFAQKHPDFNEFFDSGAIEKLMDKNPAHTPLSAYYELSQVAQAQKGPTEADIKKQIDDAVKVAVEKAVKEKEQQMLTDFKTKGKAFVLGGGAGPGRAEISADDELKDTKKQGGLLTVLTERSKRREEHRASG